jgi:FixJ family two-component response regulator
MDQLSPALSMAQTARMGSTAPLIAVVDDDEGVRRALCRLVRTFRYDAVAFASGEDFLQSLQVRLPGCVVMDLHLPGLNGLEVLAHLRNRNGAPPMIVMTGFDQTGTRVTCLAAGAVDYVTKPIEGHRLAEAISQALGLS